MRSKRLYLTEDLDGWYEVNVSYPSSYVFGYLEEKGYVSKTVVLESPCTESLDSLIAERRNKKDEWLSYSYVYVYNYRNLPNNGEYKTISITANPDFYILTERYNDYYTLWLGKVVDNVFVFKYPVLWQFICDERAGDRICVDNSGEENIIYYAEDGPLINQNTHYTGFRAIFHFDNFDDDMIERLFKDAIEEQRTGAVYYNMDIMFNGWY